MGIKIRGIGGYLPPIEVTNAMFERLVDTSDAWITSRTGIKTRHLSDGEPTWSMATAAARKALEHAGAEASEVDAILVSSVTPDYHTPSTSCILQAELGAEHAFCLDFNVACSGFVYGYDLAVRYLCDPDIRNVLIVCSERLSGITDYTDRSTCVLFGDGAGAMLIGKEGDTDGVDWRNRVAKLSHLGAEGKLGHTIISRAVYHDHPFQTQPDNQSGRYGTDESLFLRMEGQEVYRFAIRVLVDAVRQVLDQNELTLDDIAWIVPHQANDRILEASARRLGIEPDRMISYIADIGNTSSATIPLCLDRMVKEGRLQRGDRVILCGFGGGLTYGAALLEY